MKQTQLAKILEISAQHVSDLKRGRRQFTLKMAAKFEQITGIPSYKWTHPEQFGDPWKELENIPLPEQDCRQGGERRKGQRRTSDDRRREDRRACDRQDDQTLPAA